MIPTPLQYSSKSFAKDARRPRSLEFRISRTTPVLTQQSDAIMEQHRNVQKRSRLPAIHSCRWKRAHASATNKYITQALSGRDCGRPPRVTPYGPHAEGRALHAFNPTAPGPSSGYRTPCSPMAPRGRWTRPRPTSRRTATPPSSTNKTMGEDG